MKKVIMILILSALLTACGNTSNMAEEEKAETSAVSQTTTTAAVTASEAETTTTKTVSETTTTTKAVTTAETTSTSKNTTTTKSETTTSKSTTKKTVSESTTARQPIKQTETYIVYYDEPSPETQQTQPEVRVTETTTTTVQTTPPTTTTTSPPTTTTTAPPSGIEWSESMKVWRNLCGGKKLTGSEQDIIRSEILDYAVSSFNGKKDIHVIFGIDNYDISYEKPLNLTINRGMTSMANAHMDAYVDANRKSMIDYASSEDEIYSIICETREKCLHVIDYGLYNRWEIFSMNGSLKYASDIELNVGFDEDMAIWFLTQD